MPERISGSMAERFGMEIRMEISKDRIYESLCEIAGRENVFTDEDMSRHVTFRAGGRAKYFLTPPSKQAMAAMLSYLRAQHINYYIIGNGSNLLVRDEGYDGVIVKIGGAFSDIKIDLEKNQLYFGAGTYLSKAAGVALEHSLTGMEFAAGIPGMIGGAVAMNAGAYGGELKDIIDQVWVMNTDGRELCLSNEEMQFGYRTSLLQKEKFICLGASVILQRGSSDEIAKKMQELLEARKEKQPLEYPSAGSTFKRPEGYFAGKLIMEAGLRGFSVGEACVSEKHCGFVVNKGKATATDIINVIDKVTEMVYKSFGIKLEPEVKII